MHTKRQGTAYDPKGIPLEPQFGESAANVEEFLDRSQADVAIEITTLNPSSGEPAISHIRAAFARGIHVITANKGPIAFAYADLAAEARAAQVIFRFESTVMDGTPIFNKFRNNLPGVELLGFEGVLNSTSKVVLSAMAHGRSLDDGVLEAQRLGIAEANVSYDLDGWDSAAKAAALANVLMDARLTPQDVKRQGIASVDANAVTAARSAGDVLLLVSRGIKADERIRLEVKPEVVRKEHILASGSGTSNTLVLHTDLMGALAAVSVDPGVDQTAYGLFADLVDIARSV